MPGGLARVVVKGEAGIKREFRKVERDVQRGLGLHMKAAAEPIRSTAEQLAMATIPNIGPKWSRMRIGIARAGQVVYIAPKTRGHGSRRPNLAPLLKDQAMIPALDHNRGEVIRAFELLVSEALIEARF